MEECDDVWMTSPKIPGRVMLTNTHIGSVQTVAYITMNRSTNSCR
jgi:hypothetical protein